MSATMAQVMPQQVHCEMRDDGIAVLRLGDATETVVTWTRERLESLTTRLESLLRDSRLRGLVITGPGPGMFCAGADLALIAQVQTAAEGEAAARQGRDCFALLQRLRVPVVAAIEGPCLGGGLELCLFADLRIASDHAATQLGLPEVKLGIVPGFGGTQTLTRLCGLPIALELILQGKLLRPKQALKKGVIDRLVPATRLLPAAFEELQRLIAQKRKAPRRRLRGSNWLLSSTPARKLALDRARKELGRGQNRFYPAPRRAVDLCAMALTAPPEQGFTAEAKALGELIVSPESRGLQHVFALTEHSKRLGKGRDIARIERAAVIGGGVMGAGIASLLAQKGVRTRLCDLDGKVLARARARLRSDLDKKVARRSLQAHEARAMADNLAVATEWGSLAQCDLWLEAVVEDLGVKQKLLAEAVRRGLPEHAILATNTSSLSIDAMAAQVPNPSRLVGIHFFNPPEKMPLVEVIRGAQTGDAAVAAACKLALRLGKFPIVVRDGAGFLVNRCLSPYLNEAAALLLEGTEPETIDQAMLDFGMPMGPCRLLDEVGLDVAAKVSEVMQQAFPDRMVPSPLLRELVQAGALGRKADGCFYDQGGRRPGPGRAVLACLREGRGAMRSAPRNEIVQRLIYPMVAEAWRCLDEGIVASAQDLDLGLVMGIGFPPFHGGITPFARREGLRTIVAVLDDLSRRLHGRFAPGDALRRVAIDEGPQTPVSPA